MQTAGITLLSAGIPASNIHKENFLILQPVTRAIPPDTDPHRLIIQYDGQVYHVQAQYPKTILQAGLDAGIDLPYSCLAGRCGTCAAVCTSGKVWMSYNEVLPDEEIAKGRVLTCVGYAVGGDAELYYR
jgi:ring-1,2-phenylacetyl-CoA epoxidase subunit PaaE